jgi:hypothetical protein
MQTRFAHATSIAARPSWPVGFFRRLDLSGLRRVLVLLAKTPARRVR